MRDKPGQLGIILIAALSVIGMGGEACQAAEARGTMMVGARVVAPSCLAAAANRQQLSVSCTGSVPLVLYPERTASSDYGRSAQAGSRSSHDQDGTGIIPRILVTPNAEPGVQQDASTILTVIY